VRLAPLRRGWYPLQCNGPGRHQLPSGRRPGRFLPLLLAAVGHRPDCVGSRGLILCWHNVSGTWSFPSPAGSGQRGLERQLRVLSRWANVLPLDVALRRLADGGRLPPRAVALTFDDGYRDNLTHAVPMLKALQLPATFFLVPGLLSNTALPWWEQASWAIKASRCNHLDWQDQRLPLLSDNQRQAVVNRVQRDLKSVPRAERDSETERLRELLVPRGPGPTAEGLFLDWDEARQLIHQGFDIGSHTCQHTILSRETDANQVQELVDSRRLLENRCEAPAELLAYPNGTVEDYDAATLLAAASAGHQWALTTREGFNGRHTAPLELRRVVMYPERGVVELLATLRFAYQSAK